MRVSSGRRVHEWASLWWWGIQCMKGKRARVYSGETRQTGTTIVVNYSCLSVLSTTLPLFVN